MASRSPPMTPRTMPRIPPASEINTASARNCLRISRLRAQTSSDPHRTDRAVKRLVVLVLCERPRRDVYRPVRLAVVLEETGDRNDADVILALTEGGPFRFQATYNGVSVAANANNLADR